MKCVSCGSNFKVGKGKTFMGRCPKCGHNFTILDPKAAGLSDTALKRAITNVSESNKYLYLPEHHAYEVKRLLIRRAKHAPKYRIGAAVLGILIVGLLISDIDTGIKFFLSVVCGFLAVYLLQKASILKHAAKDSKVFDLVARFQRLNPSDHLVSGNLSQRTDLSRTSTSELKLPPNRVLICEQNQVVDFLLANEFELHTACPVIGPSGYPSDDFPALLSGLKQRSDFEVFVLHNLTPVGLAFAEQVKSSPEWFGQNPDATIVDLGFNPEHIKPLTEVLRPLREIKGAGSSGQIPGLPANMGAELTAIRPLNLLAMLWMSLETRTPFPVVLESKDDKNNDKSKSE